MPCADPLPGCCGAHRRNGEDYIVSVAGTYKLIHYYDTFFYLGSKPTHSIVFAYFYGAKPTLTPRLVDLSNFFQQFAHMIFAQIKHPHSILPSFLFPPLLYMVGC